MKSGGRSRDGESGSCDLRRVKWENAARQRVEAQLRKAETNYLRNRRVGVEVVVDVPRKA